MFSITPEDVFVYLPEMVVVDIYGNLTSTVYNCLRDIGERWCSSKSNIEKVLKRVGGKVDRAVETKYWFMLVQESQTIHFL